MFLTKCLVQNYCTNLENIHRVLYYGRFKDDGFILLSCFDQSSIDALINFMSARSKFFKLQFGEPSRDTNFLDIRLWMGPCWKKSGRLDHTLHHKATSLYQPFALSSHHPMHVHSVWPKGMVARINALVHAPVYRRTEYDNLVHKLSSRLGFDYVTGILSCASPYIQPKEVPWSRIVLPCHRYFEFAPLQRTLVALKNKYRFLELSGAPIHKIGLAWKLPAKRMLHMRLRYNLESHITEEHFSISGCVFGEGR